MIVRQYAVSICDGCIKLDGQMCHTPECAFCRKTTLEIAEILDAIQLRYVVDGEIIELHESAVVAAAPDLLAACKAFFAADHHDHLAARMSDSEMVAIEAMKAAIAKAEGNS